MTIAVSDTGDGFLELSNYLIKNYITEWNFLSWGGEPFTGVSNVFKDY